MDNTTDKQKRAAEDRQRTDAAEVAMRVGVSSSLVRKVLAGTRRNEKVTKAYRTLLKEREKARQQFQTNK